jgi:crotonobetainyl-CoA:carnitine CoA-transferase CaiB-like acyl-CoA transferase
MPEPPPWLDAPPPEGEPPAASGSAALRAAAPPALAVQAEPRLATAGLVESELGRRWADLVGRLVQSGSVAALVDHSGRLVWLCWPRLDGDPVFCALLDGGAPFYDTYETADGRHISLAALEPKFFAQLAAALGLDDSFVRGQHDRSLWPAMRAAIAAAVKQHSRSEWCERLEGSDCCFAPVLSFEEAATHPHAQARDAFTSVGGLVQPAPAPRFSRTPAGPLRPPPALGTDGEALLLEADFSDTEIAALRAAGVLR